MKQVGLCTHACPVGFYPNSAGEYHRCSRCRIENCDTCFSRTFCSRCEPPYVGLYGKCVLQCPDNMYVNEMTSQCEVKVDCAVSPWSPWSPCIKKGQTCGFKWGEHRRYREIIARPTPGAIPCPELVQTEKCRTQQRYCPGHLPKKQKDKDKRKRQKDKEITDSQEVTPRKRDGNKKERTNRKNKKRERQKTPSRDEKRERQRKDDQLIEFPLSTRRTI
nr:R-spondin-2-like [Lytechinus pictus]